MSIELGSAIGSVASGVARGAPSIARGVSAPIGGIGKVGLETSIGTTEGFLPGFKPMGTADIKAPEVGGLFKSKESLNLGKSARPRLNTAEVVSEAESIISQAQRHLKPLSKSTVIPFERVKPRTLESSWTPKVESPTKTQIGPNTEVYQSKPKILVFPRVVPVPSWEPVIKPKEAPEVQVVAKTASQPRTENQTISKTTQEVFTQSFPKAQEQEVEEVVKEKVKVIEKPKEISEKETVLRRRKFLVDQQVLAIVLSEAYQAFDKAKKEIRGSGKKILGTILAKLLPGQHEGNTGGAVKPHGVDGTIAARREAIAAVREFRSKEEVKAIALEIRPITIGENGESAKQEEISTTFRDQIVKPPKVIEIIKGRLIKKRVMVATKKEFIPVPIIAKPELQSKTEHTLGALGLTKVFSKAA